MKSTKLIIVSLLLVVFVFGISALNTKGEVLPFEFEYKYIEVEKGDTLYSIASEYNDKDYYTNKEYVEMVADINSIPKNDIKVGEKILIPIIVVLEAE